MLRPGQHAEGAIRLLDAIVFSNLWVAAAAALLTAAAARAMGVAPAPAAVGLAASGTLMVYGIDRLRDVSADRETAPARTAFVEQNRRALTALCGGAGLAALGFAAAAGPATIGLTSACGLAGLGLAVALTGPARVRPLACVSGATLLALAGFREGERYGMGVADGALAAGAVALGP